jgi:hypothetical protein
MPGGMSVTTDKNLLQQRQLRVAPLSRPLQWNFHQRGGFSSSGALEYR